MRGTGIYRIGAAIAAAALVALAPLPALAGAQVEEKLAQSVVSGLQRALLEPEFPGLEFFNIPGYEIRHKRGVLLKWALIFRIPSILRQIRREHDRLEQWCWLHGKSSILGATKVSE